MTDNFATHWEAIADALPDHVAVVHGESRTTWKQLEDRASRLAGGLQSAGIKEGDKVALYLFNSPAYVEATYAAFKLRAIPVNVNYRYRSRELAYLLENSDSLALVYHGALAKHVEPALSQIRSLRAVLEVRDQHHLAGRTDYENFIVSSHRVSRIARDGDDLVFIYTGGTTGLPKGVMWRQADLLYFSRQGFASRGIAPIPDELSATVDAIRKVHDEGRVLVTACAAPFMHGVGLVGALLPTLTMGGTLITFPNRSFDPRELWLTVARERAELVVIAGEAFAKPMVDELSTSAANGESYDLRSLRAISSGGAILSARTKRALLERCNATIYDSLSSTEALGQGTAVSTGNAITETAQFQMGAGAIVLDDAGEPVMPGSGAVGRIAVTGRLPVGYYQDDEKTRSTFPVIDGKRYALSGDFATVDADRTIRFLGRGSVCINTGGEKVYPEEVEEAIKAFNPTVVDCNVVGVSDELWGESVAALVSVTDVRSFSEAEIIATVRAELAGYKCPKRVILVPEIYRSPSGKADYQWARRTLEGLLSASTTNIKSS